MAIRIRSVEPGDRMAWDTLYAGYAAFYGVAQTDVMRDRVWGWLMDPDHSTTGFVAVDAAGTLVGLAHVRPFARPLSATTGGFLDDLFVDPGKRGSGAADALLQAVQALGRDQGWSVIRWITADDNYRARGVYDKRAKRTGWITYDMAPGDSDV